MSSNISKCLWVEQVTTFALFNVTGREFSLLWFFRKIYFLCLFVGIWIKLHFPLKAQLLIACKSLFNTLWFVFIKNIWKKDVSSAKVLQGDRILAGKLSIYIKNRRGPTTESCGTPDFINSQEEIWPPLGTTLWLRSWI